MNPSKPPRNDRNTGLARLTVAAVRVRRLIHERQGMRRLLLRPLGLVAAFWLEIVIGSDIPAEALVGPGLRLPHAGRGIVIHPTCRIGSDVTIYHNVTLGMRGNEEQGPVIGDGTYIGAGAIIVGRVTIGAGAHIGAGAVVVTDVPAGATAVGPKARIITTND